MKNSKLWKKLWKKYNENINKKSKIKKFQKVMKNLKLWKKYEKYIMKISIKNQK